MMAALSKLRPLEAGGAIPPPAGPGASGDAAGDLSRLLMAHPPCLRIDRSWRGLLAPGHGLGRVPVGGGVHQPQYVLRGGAEGIDVGAWLPRFADQSDTPPGWPTRCVPRHRPSGWSIAAESLARAHPGGHPVAHEALHPPPPVRLPPRSCLHGRPSCLAPPAPVSDRLPATTNRFPPARRHACAAPRLRLFPLALSAHLPRTPGPGMP